MKKYVVFDIDGTLNQTELYAVKAYKKALIKRNISVEENEIISCIGLTPDAIIKKFFGALKDEDLESWQNDIRNYEYELMEEKAQPFNGIEETLILLRKLGYNLAICSNAFPEHIERVLTTINLNQYFNIIGSLKMGNSKNEVLSGLLEKMESKKVCMVGDRRFDIEAARYNSIPVIGCAYGYAPQEVRDADIIVTDPSEILEAVNKLL